MSKRNNLIKKFQNISHQHDLWQKGNKIVVACSGGPDSTCMLDIFAKLQKKYDLKLIIAHVNYKLRGKDSDEDEKFVRKLAENYDLQFVLLKSKIKDRNNLENRLRKIRYNFFEKVRRDNNFDLIAVAHTLDDQAETVLMRIIRGSGLAGLSAMKHKSVYPVKSVKGGSRSNTREFNRGNIIRPLLGITKKEILEYLKKNKLLYRIDKTNKEIPYLRNKIRNELIPLLEKKYNPNIKETLYNSSLSVAQDYDFINELAEINFQKNKKLAINKILKLPLALQKRMILKAVEKKTGNLKDIEMANVEEVLKAMKSMKSKNQIVKFRGLKFMRKDDRMFLSLIN